MRAHLRMSEKSSTFAAAKVLKDESDTDGNRCFDGSNVAAEHRRDIAQRPFVPLAAYPSEQADERGWDTLRFV